MKRFSNIVGALLACVLLLLFVAAILFVQFANVSVSSMSTLPSGRTVTVQSEGWGGINVQDSADTTTLSLGRHTIVVAPSQIIVDGRTLAPIEGGVKSVSIHAHNGEINFAADGAEIASMDR